MHLQLKWSFLLVLVSLCLATSTFARDISNEQRAASEARDRYNQLKSESAILGKQIADQEKRVATEQARLQTLQKQQAENQSALESAKADLDAKVQTLESVWEQRNKN